MSSVREGEKGVGASMCGIGFHPKVPNGVCVAENRNRPQHSGNRCLEIRRIT